MSCSTAFALLGFVITPGVLFAQAADPGVRGPVRRALSGAAAAVGAPGVGQRIENREQARANSAGNPNAWRYRWHNNQWWYYTPQNQWMYYRNNAWQNYAANRYVRPNMPYASGYRGPANPGNANLRSGPYLAPNAGVAAPGAAPYSNGTRAGNFGSNLGADIGAATNTNQGVNSGAAIGGAIGSAVGAARNNNAATPPSNNAPTKNPAANNPPAENAPANNPSNQPDNSPAQQP